MNIKLEKITFLDGNCVTKLDTNCDELNEYKSVGVAWTATRDPPLTFQISGVYLTLFPIAGFVRSYINNNVTEL